MNAAPGSSQPAIDATILELRHNRLDVGLWILRTQGSVDDALAMDAVLEQNAKDIAAFLSWAGDPTLNERKRIGWQVMLYLLITTVLLYLAKKRIWARIPH